MLASLVSSMVLLAAAATSAQTLLSPTFDGCGFSVAGGATNSIVCGGNNGQYQLTLTSSNPSTSCQVVPATGSGTTQQSAVTVIARASTGNLVNAGTCTLTGRTVLGLLNPGDQASILLPALNLLTTTVRVGGNPLSALTNTLGITQANEPVDLAVIASCISVLGQLQCGSSNADVQVRLLQAQATGGGGGGRRRRREAEIQQAMLAYNHPECPVGKTSCPVPGLSPTSGAYECLDIMTELESCGGCASVGTGINCAASPGVAWSGTSCVQGKCQISQCRRGWKLTAGHCVRV